MLGSTATFRVCSERHQACVYTNNLGIFIAVASYDAASLSPFTSGIRPHGPRCRAFWEGGGEDERSRQKNAVPRLVVGWRILDSCPMSVLPGAYLMHHART